jgi:hypothetical protein
VSCRINSWFKSLVTSAINPIFAIAGTSLLATPRLDRWSRVASLWDGSLTVVNTVFVLFVLAAGVILMGRQSLQTAYAVKDIAPRLVCAFVLANISLPVIGHGIELANGLSAALVGQGVDPRQAAGQLKKVIVHAINPADVGIAIVLVAIWAMLLAAILTVTYLVRIMLTIVLIAAAPLALACHALPQTQTMAATWWRAIIGVLAVQVAQSLVFITAMKVLFSTDMIAWFGVHTPGDQVDLWLTLCLLYVLVRIPAWISRMIWKGGLSASPIVRTAKTVAMLLVFRGAFSKLNTARRAKGNKPRPPASTPSRPRRTPTPR